MALKTIKLLKKLGLYLDLIRRKEIVLYKVLNVRIQNSEEELQTPRVLLQACS